MFCILMQVRLKESQLHLKFKKHLRIWYFKLNNIHIGKNVILIYFNVINIYKSIYELYF